MTGDGVGVICKLENSICFVKKKKNYFKDAISSFKRFVRIPGSLELVHKNVDFTALEGNVGPEIENVSGIGRNICMKNCIMWNTKRRGERAHGRVAPKVFLSLLVTSISGINFGCFFDNPGD